MSAAPAALAPSQHKAGLWADDRLQAHAVVMGERINDLPALLAQADVVNFDCLVPGALPARAQRRAAYMVQLKRESPFTDWLLFKAAAAFGPWGVVVRTRSPFTPLRTHLRFLTRAATPEGEEIPLAWMDPEVIEALLPIAPPDQLARFFGPLQSITIVGSDAWTTFDGLPGPLESRRVPVLAAA